jgi:hypothetical protein
MQQVEYLPAIAFAQARQAGEYATMDLSLSEAASSP